MSSGKKSTLKLYNYCTCSLHEISENLLIVKQSNSDLIKTSRLCLTWSMSNKCTKSP